MLPSILKVGSKYNLTFDSKTYGDKETRAKCPFCLEDSIREGKYFLSLNVEKNLFKCWYCNKSGGVLHLESLLSGKSFQEVRIKYFGNRGKSNHPAYQLSPEQLEKIGWRQIKRNNFSAFRKNREDVIQQWKVYKFEQLSIYYAIFLLMARFTKENKEVHWDWFKEITKTSRVEDLSSIVINQYKKHRKEKWAVYGEVLAKIAYEISKDSMDIDLINIYSNILLALEVRKLKVRQRKNRVTNSA